MIFSIDRIIAYVSQFMTLKKGDLIYTGTPAGVGPIAIGDKLTGFIGEREMLSVRIK
jgi:2-keto-4-pentenoate hydratase/2-oxohepta-3-ene-1,7-dioic acid hydratase in catechol pathway